jgi:hypothetical protein
VLAGGPAPSPLAEQAANLVGEWVNRGASRLGENRPEDPGAAVLDAAWTPIAEAVLGPVLGELTGAFAQLATIDNAPSPSGSAYGEGWYGYVYKDLRTELGLPVQAPFSRRYCGGGKLKACRASLWAAIQGAAEALQKSQGNEPKAWRAAPVRIGFAPGFLPYTMRWTNRSTFQQVIEFLEHAPREAEEENEGG